MKKLSQFLSICLFVLFTSYAFAAGSVNINKAEATVIATTLKGVGLKKAQAIITYRKKHGPFKTVEDLAKVKGIGLKTVEKNRAYILLSENTKKSK